MTNPEPEKQKTEEGVAEAPADAETAEVSGEAPTEANQPRHKVINFPDQMKAYQWLLWRCPTEYHFMSGIDKTNGQQVVQIILPA